MRAAMRDAARILSTQELDALPPVKKPRVRSPTSETEDSTTDREEEEVRRLARSTQPARSHC